MMLIQEILEFANKQGIACRFEGSCDCAVEGYSTLKNYKENTMTWAKNELAYQYQMQDKRLVIAQEGLKIDAPNVLYTAKSKQLFFRLVACMAEQKEPSLGGEEPVGAGTIIGKGVKIGENVRIGCNCVINGNIRIGSGTVIWDNVTIINNVVIGANCEIQSGCVIGHDGFAWNENERHEKEMIRHYGGVAIGDDVYLGPNCIVDRGEIDHTTIGRGNKIDGGCFIAHNVVTGNHVIMITGSRLYGSVELGDNVYIASATVRNQCKIGKHTMVGIGAVVTKDIPAYTTVAGVPAKALKGEQIE